jgi:hypothetical protein
MRLTQISGETSDRGNHFGRPFCNDNQLPFSPLGWRWVATREPARQRFFFFARGAKVNPGLTIGRGNDWSRYSFL